jgi:hypothetical protein
MKRLFIFIALSLISSSVLAAQSAMLRGTVHDLQDSAISGAEVVLKAGEQVIAKIQPDAAGSFSVRIEPGRYTVEIEAPGFERVVRTVNLTAALAPQTFFMKPSEPDLESRQGIADDDQEMADLLMDFAGSGRPESSGDMVFDLLVATPPDDSSPAIRGTVLDDQQNAVIGAEVLVKTADRIVIKVQTGSDGTFSIPLRLGGYTVEVTAAGFEKAIQNLNLTLTSEPLSFQLKVP